MNAAESLGGEDRIPSTKTLETLGYGQMPYINGGGNITASPDAPQNWWNVGGVEWTIDFEHSRMRDRLVVEGDFIDEGWDLV